MSRSGYIDYDGGDEFDNLRSAGWAANVRRCMAGRTGQAFLWELYLALEALPERVLITGALVDLEGSYCSLGAVARFRGKEIPPELRETAEGEPDDIEFYEAVVPLLGIKELLAREIMYQNDECDEWHMPDGHVVHSVPWAMRDVVIRSDDTPAERWQRMRDWAVSQLKGIP